MVFTHTCCSFTLRPYPDSSAVPTATDVTATVTIVVRAVITEVVDDIKGSVTSALCNDDTGNIVESSLVDVMLETDVDGTM